MKELQIVGGLPKVDQTYTPDSTNAQSGIAIKEAISNKAEAAHVAYINDASNDNVEIDKDIAVITTVDSALSETSTNPVQNNIVTQNITRLEADKIDKTSIVQELGDDPNKVLSQKAATGEFEKIRVIGINKFNKDSDDFLLGFYSQNLTFTENGNYYITHPIRVEGGVTYKWAYYSSIGTSAPFVYCDYNGNAIGVGSVDSVVNDYAVHTFAEDAVIRVCVSHARIGKIMFCKEQEYPSSYVGFCYKIGSSIELGDTQIEQVEKMHDEYMESVKTDEQSRSIYPMITFVDDDGHAKVMTKLKPLSETYGIPFTVAIPSERITDTTGTWLTTENLLELQAMGWEISSHTHNHIKLGELTDEEQELQMKLSKETLEAAGLKVTSICYPNSSVNEKTYKFAMKYYECGRRTNFYDQINTSPLQTWDLRAIPIGSYFTTTKLTDLDTSSLEYYKWCVDQAVANNGWLIFMTHCNEHNSTQQGYIEETIQYIQSLNIPVVTLTDGFRIRKNRFEVGRVLHEDNTLPHFAVGCDGKISMTNNVERENYHGGTLDTVYNMVAPKGALTRFLITTDGATHKRPDGNGVLFTDRTQNNEHYTYQYYAVGYKGYTTPHIYVRQWNPIDRVWTDFACLTERAGTSAYRNLASTPKYVGACIFDTTLGKPVWYNGTNWVDATGAIV
jgi:peptidoglycan/xylan/chitin deacetylase (PgdA/CDA1 family)